MSTYGTYFNNILTTTTSKYSQLRQKLTNSEADGETEDDSHISRVLREYYTEKGGRWPEWLGPDPRAPVQVVQSSNTAAYGGQPQQGFVSSSGGAQPGQAAGGRWGRGGLSDLWDSNGKAGQPEQESASLRARAGLRTQASSTSSQLPTAGNLQGGAGRPLARNNESYLNPNAGLQARPLPSQRAGSYQTQGSTGRMGTPDQNPLTTTLSGASAMSGTASDRLKQRLWGAGGTAPSTASSGRASPTTQQSYSGSSGAGYSNNSNGGDQRGYEQPASSYSRYDSPSQSSRGSGQGNPYTDPRSTRSGGGGYSSSNPYDTGSTQGDYGGGPYAQQQQPQRGGLPTGPRPQR